MAAPPKKAKLPLWGKALVAVVLLGAIVWLTTGGGKHGRHHQAVAAATGAVGIARSEYGAHWPFERYSEGLLRCDPLGDHRVGDIVFTSPDGTEWGINGTAHDDGYRNFDSIWRFAPGERRYGLRVSVSPIISRGLALCEGSR